MKNNKILFWDLDFGFHTIGANSREEFPYIIRILGPNLLLLSSRVENAGNTKAITNYKDLFTYLSIPFKLF